LIEESIAYLAERGAKIDDDSSGLRSDRRHFFVLICD